MKNSTTDLSWLKSLSEVLPEKSKIRKNIIEIAGYPSWETVTSNLLAFYLDQNEEHGFGRLFFNSLLDLYESKTTSKAFNRATFDSDYTVEREVSTNSGRRIDILIYDESEAVDQAEYNKISSNWSVIIENKINASLYNDLSDYWKSTKAKIKIGIVISIQPIPTSINLAPGNALFINITHLELISKVKNNLSDYYFDSDDRHLLFLKEYIANIQSFYTNKKDSEAMQKIHKAFIDNQKNIDEFKKNDLELLRYISNSIFGPMIENGFEPTSEKDSSKGKHFYVCENIDSIPAKYKADIKYLDMFRFYIDIGRLRYVTDVKMYFELYGTDYTKYGDKLKEALINNAVSSSEVTIGTGGKSGAGYQHIYEICFVLNISEGVDLKSEFKKRIEEVFFSHPKKFLETVINELKVIVP